MNYSRRVYNRAAAVLEKRRYQAEHDQRMHRQEAYSSIPELAAIDREIASAGAEVIKAIGMGENAQTFIDDLSKRNLAAQKHREDMLKAAKKRRSKKRYEKNGFHSAGTQPVCRTVYWLRQ